MATNTYSTLTLVHPSAIADNPAEAITIASRTLAALAVVFDRVQHLDLDRSAACGFLDMLQAIRATLDGAAEQVGQVWQQMDAVANDISEFEEKSLSRFPMINGKQCLEARKLLNWTPEETARRFGCVNSDAINFLEGSGTVKGGMHGMRRRSLARVFIEAGVEFLDDGTVRLAAPTALLTASQGE